MVEGFAQLVAFPEISMILGKLRDYQQALFKPELVFLFFTLEVPRTVKTGVAGKVVVRLQTMQLLIVLLE